MIINVWLHSDSHDRKPIKVQVIDGVPVAELPNDDGKPLKLTEKGREYYLQQLALQGYNLK